MKCTMKENIHNPNDEAQLRLENEIKKLNLEMEGAVFQYMSEDFPLDLEKQFLDTIMGFETQSKNAVYMPLYKFLGEPFFLPFDVLPDEHLEQEFERLNDILQKNGVDLDFLCDYSLETRYRFITEEFLNHEISDMHIPGMINSFIFEEFHPNYEHDLRNDTESFFHAIMNLGSDFVPYFLSPIMEMPNKGLVDRKMYEGRIAFFRDRFHLLRINLLEIKKVTITDVSEISKTARVDFELDYEGIATDKHRKVSSADKGYLNFLFADDYWTINSIVFKGF
jgi:hypothetical protein